MRQGPGLVVAGTIESEGWGDASWPLGATHDPVTGVTTFAIHAPAATRVLLELYPTALGSDAEAQFAMARARDGVWCVAVPGLAHGTLYAFRCWGHNWPWDARWRRGGSGAGFRSDLDTDGNRFNPNKVLFDPYAREITHTPLSNAVGRAGARPMIFATGPMPYAGRPSREADTGRVAPKAILVLDETRTGNRPPGSLGNNPSIYEAHVKNLTMHPSASCLSALLGRTPGFEHVVDVPEALRGTYAGASLMAPYLRALGITTIELMPVHETDTDHEGSASGTTNHWGYQTIGFFAPNRDYAHDKSPGGPTREFKEMVRAFHEGGIEVVLDVVYNHTGEGGHWYADLNTTGFTSLGGFATADYYVLSPDHHLVDGATGTSNQLNFSSWASRQLVLDSLEYWHTTMGVDGFRFDLAPVLGRHPNLAPRDDWGGQRRFFGDHPLLTSVRNLAVLEGFEIIAEPWDLWGDEIGNFPTGWLEWNGRFRDGVRRFLKGDGNTGEFTNELNGELLRGPGGHPRSINFVAAHDGFTMMDLVSFTRKHNLQPYPFGPSDGGTDDNLSWDSGLDQRLRRARWRNSWLLVFLARGVPMVVSGDEYGRTQNGNNNPWDLNTVALWNNWAQTSSNAPTRVPVDPANPGPAGPSYYDVVGETDAPPGVNPLLRFARFVAHLRRDSPTFRQTPWGELLLGSNEDPYRFLRPDLQGPPADGDRALAVSIDGGQTAGARYLLLVNMWTEPIRFTLPNFRYSAHPAGAWARIVDTAPWAEASANCWSVDRAERIGTEGYVVQPWSCVLLQAVDAPAGATRPRRPFRPARRR